MDKDTSIFGKKGTTLSDVMEDIYTHTKSKDAQIIKLIEDLKGLIKTVNDAIVVVPLINQYLEVAVKNDKHLVDLSVVMQRFITAQQKIDRMVKIEDYENQLTFSESDKKALFEIFDKANDDLDLLKINDKKNELVENIKNEIEREALKQDMENGDDDE